MSKQKMAPLSVGGGHWQDFRESVPLTAERAGAMFRAITSVATTLGFAAHHLTLLVADRKNLTVLSANDMESPLAGALQLAQMPRAKLEGLHS